MSLSVQTLLELARLGIFLALAVRLRQFARQRGLQDELAFRLLSPGLLVMALAQLAGLSDNTTVFDSARLLGPGPAAQALRASLYLLGIVLSMLGVWNVIPLFDRLRERTRELEQSRALQHAITEQAPDLLMLVELADDGGIVVDCNPRTLDILGRTREQCIGQSMLAFMPERQPDGRPSRDLLRVVFAASGSEALGEVRAFWRRADGSPAETTGTVSRVRAGGREYIQMRGREIGGAGRGLMQSLPDIVAALSTAAGEDFFLELARGVHRIFGVEQVLVGRFADEGRCRLETLAHLLPGGMHRDIMVSEEMLPADSPFAQVREGRVVVYAGNLQQRFPHIDWYRDNDITSWLGVPARDSGGRVVGVVALFGRGRLADPLQVEYVVQIFASRVAAEIERRDALKALRHGAADLRMALAASDTALWDWNPQNDELRLARVGADQGEDLMETRGSLANWLGGRAADEAEPIERLLHGSLRDAKAVRFEFSNVHAGRQYWFEAVGRPQAQADGGALRVRGTVRDITERHRVQEALATLARASTGQGLDAFLRGTVSSLAGLFAVDVISLERYLPGTEPRMRVIAEWEDGAFVEGYEYVVEGTPEGEAIRTRAIYECDDVPAAFPDDPWYRQRAKRACLSAPLIDARGEAIGVISLIHSAPVRLPAWSRSLLRVFAERIALELDRHDAISALESHRQGLEARVAERTQRVRDQARVLDTIREAVVVRDHAGVIQWVNAGTVLLFGHAREQLTGRGMDVLLAPAERARFNALGVDEVFGDADWRERELAAVHADGHVIEVLLRSTVVRDEHGAVRQIIDLLLDVSQRRAAERDLQRSRGELAELAAELEAFSYSVSHDLRGPLRAIDGFSEALEEDCAGQLDPAGQEYLRRIRASARRMSQLIDDLLDFARISRREPDRATVDLAQLAREAVDRLREAEPGRMVEVSIAGGLQCEGDRGLLAIVMDNLVGNAWKYTGKVAAARIEIGVETDADARVFFVRDNGAGFDMRFADRLFGVFQRLHQQGEFEGTGVGLATVKRIVQRHGGTIWAHAEPAKGACFRFTLARAEDS